MESSVIFSRDPSRVNEGMLGGFFVGWPDAPDPATHLEILHRSDHVVLALASRPETVVGFVTCISDGILSAFVPLLEVLPSWQGKGIGTELLQMLLEEVGGLYAVDLVCDPDLESFYEPLGFRAFGAMIRRNYVAQGGRRS